MAKAPNPEVQIALITGSLKDRWELIAKFTKTQADTLFIEISQRGFDVTDGSEISQNQKNMKVTGEHLFSKALQHKKVTEKSALLFFKYCWSRGDTYSSTKDEFFAHLNNFPKTQRQVCSVLADNMTHFAFFKYAEAIKKNNLFRGHEDLFLLKVKQAPFSGILPMVSKIDNLIAREYRSEGLLKIQALLQERISYVNNQELHDWLMKGQQLSNFYNRDNYTDSVSTIMFHIVKTELEKRKEIPKRDKNTLSLKEISKLSK